MTDEPVECYAFKLVTTHCSNDQAWTVEKIQAKSEAHGSLEWTHKVLKMIPYLKVDKMFHRKTAILSVGGFCRNHDKNELIVVPHRHLIYFTYLP